MTRILTTRRAPRDAGSALAIFALVYVAALGFVFLPDGPPPAAPASATPTGAAP